MPTMPTMPTTPPDAKPNNKEAPRKSIVPERGSPADQKRTDREPRTVQSEDDDRRIERFRER